MQKEKTPINKKAAFAVTLIAVIAISAFLTVGYNTIEQPIQPPLQGVGVNVEIHCHIQHYRNGILISESYHPMTLVNAGLDWIADKLFNSAGTNVTQYAMYIGSSTDDTAVDTGWICLPAESTANGLARALASWADTGTGTGTLSKSFSITGDCSSNLYGLYSNTYALAPASTLVAAEQQGAGNQKNMVNGDTLAVTITITVS